MPGQLLISDANVLIDMDAGGLLPKMFALEYTFAVPDTLFEEELRARHPELLKLGLRRLELRQEAVQNAARLVEVYAGTGASINDRVALALARQEQCPLLTGDARLRAVAESEQAEFHGTLWLMEQLVSAKLIRPATVRRAYQGMRDNARRLPWDEVEQQIKSFEN